MIPVTIRTGLLAPRGYMLKLTGISAGGDAGAADSYPAAGNWASPKLKRLDWRLKAGSPRPHRQERDGGCHNASREQLRSQFQCSRASVEPAHAHRQTAERSAQSTARTRPPIEQTLGGNAEHRYELTLQARRTRRGIRAAARAGCRHSGHRTGRERCWASSTTETARWPGRACGGRGGRERDPHADRQAAWRIRHVRAPTQSASPSTRDATNDDRARAGSCERCARSTRDSRHRHPCGAAARRTRPGAGRTHARTPSLSKWLPRAAEISGSSFCGRGSTPARSRTSSRCAAVFETVLGADHPRLGRRVGVAGRHAIRMSASGQRRRPLGSAPSPSASRPSGPSIRRSPCV